MAEIVFSAVREDIEYSVRAISNGKKGGRPRNKGGLNPTEMGFETALNPTEMGFETALNPRQDKTRQDNQGKGEGRAAQTCDPPSLDEVEAYASSAGLKYLDPAKFHDHYTATGWRRGNGEPLVDWRAEARLWNRRDKAEKGDRENIDWSVYALSRRFALRTESRPKTKRRLRSARIGPHRARSSVPR